MDWTRSMNQTFEYYEVDPVSWGNKRLIENVISCTIKHDLSKDTISSATLDTETDLGEMYIRPYLVATQDGYTERFPLGTFLVQTPSNKFDGMSRTCSVQAYSPLLELKDKKVPIGYYIPKEDTKVTGNMNEQELAEYRKENNILHLASLYTEDNVRAPVVGTSSFNILQSDYSAEVDEDWLSYLKGLMDIEDYEYNLDEMGRILLGPNQNSKSLMPVWTYTDDNSSLLYPDISLDRDLYGIPNVVEVLYTGDQKWIYSRIENNDLNSLTSIQSRGREITFRETNPVLVEQPRQDMVDAYAENILREKSTLEYTVSYTHGYCPVRVGECVRLNYTRAGYKDVHARVRTQSIKCIPGCPVDETATFTKEFWEG